MEQYILISTDVSDWDYKDILKASGDLESDGSTNIHTKWIGKGVSKQRVLNATTPKYKAEHYLENGWVFNGITSK